MANDNKNFKIKDGINVTDEVIAIIAGLSATEVEGVASLEGNLANKAIEKAGINRLSKGVKIISTETGSVEIKISINADYGCKIPEISKGVQEKVKSNVEYMTGITVDTVDVKISSVVLENAE